MGLMILDPNNQGGHQIGVLPEKGQEYKAVRIFGKDSVFVRIQDASHGPHHQEIACENGYSGSARCRNAESE